MSEKRIRRIGSFKMSEELLESEEGIAIFEQLEFIPLRVYKTSTGHYSFIGYSYKFEEVDTSDFLNDIPEYILRFSNKDGIVFEVEKI